MFSLHHKKPFTIILLLTASVCISLFLCIIFAEVYFRCKEGNWYYKKSLFSKSNVDSVNLKDKNLVERVNRATKEVTYESMEFDLLHLKRSNNYFAGPNTNLTSNSYLEIGANLTQEMIENINSGKYSFSASITCDSPSVSPETCLVLLDGEFEIRSHFQQYPEDLLTVVFPILPKEVTTRSNYDLLGSQRISNKLKLKINSTDNVTFKNLKLLMTPIEHQASVDNVNRYFRAPINYLKGKKYRILAIGGSTTYGVGSTPNVTWPCVLEQKLNAVYPGRFEVINIGMPSGNLRQFILNYESVVAHLVETDEFDSKSIDILRKELLPYRANFGLKDLLPDMVIIAPAWNDFTHEFTHQYFNIDRPIFLGYSCNQISRMVENSFIKRNLAIGYYLYKCFRQLVDLYFKRIYNSYANGESNRVEDSDKDAVLTLDSNKLNDISIDALHNKFKSNVKQLIDMFVADGAKIHLLQLPGLAFKMNGQQMQKFIEHMKKNGRMNPEQIKAYSAINAFGEKIEGDCLREISEELNVGFTDASEKFENLPFEYKLKECFFDIMHLTNTGNLTIADCIFHDLRNYFDVLYQTRKGEIN